ncbi:hypothetical protein [Helicobacter sp. T3_23-1056]
MRLLQKARDFIKRFCHSSCHSLRKIQNPNKSTTNSTNASFLTYFLTAFFSKKKSLKHIAKITSKIATFCTNLATKISHFLRIFSHIFTPFLAIFAKCLAFFTKCLKNISKSLNTVKHFAYKIPFIKNALQAISAFAKKHFFYYKRRISLKSARLIKIIKTSKRTAHHITIFFYALCGVLALFSVFLLGVRYGVESLLDSALPNAKKSPLFSSFIDSSLASSNLALIPKEYLLSLQNQQDFTTQANSPQANSPQDNAPKNAPQESTPNPPPQMPKINESKYIFYGNYSFSHALNLAKNAILERDFVRARIWIYKAWDMQEHSQMAWELYLQSYEEDAGASDEAKAEARRIFEDAKKYYGF